MQKARHPKAQFFARQGVFAALRTFSELEQRIVELNEEKARSDVFEVFAEAYLATQRKHDAAQIWPLPAAPLYLLQKLDLIANDDVVDGIFENALGQLVVYKATFLSEREPLTWPELSKFMEWIAGGQVHSRVLFTNCDDLPWALNNRHGFYCIRGTDLSRLEESDFKQIENWLLSTVSHVERKKPRAHQREALAALLPALREHDRVSAIMACGTGKTLVALWVAERFAHALSPGSNDVGTGPKILVLLPSLALVRQTLHEWLQESSWASMAYLCVCSDPTVQDGLDAIHTRQSDLDFEVTTESSRVREFFNKPFAGVKVVFSTYQSTRVVADALSASDRFDFGIFDEAHKTAGREGKIFAFALQDKNLPISKRLFLTATPRHYNPLRRDKEGDAELIFSMDDFEVYGPQAYRLSFAEAARRNIICYYKVIISVITSQQLTNELLDWASVLVGGDAVRARWVANQLALSDAVKKYGLKKIEMDPKIKTSS